MKSIDEAKRSNYRYLPPKNELYSPDIPIVTIIIDCYYKLVLVKQSVQSILNQDYHNVELLLQLHNTWIKNKESINNRIKETTNKIKNINFIGNKKLKELKLQIEQQEIEEKIKKTKNQLDKLKAIEVEDYNKKIQKIQKNIWIDYSKSEVNNLLKDHKKLLKVILNL